MKKGLSKGGRTRADVRLIMVVAPFVIMAALTLLLAIFQLAFYARRSAAPASPSPSEARHSPRASPMIGQSACPLVSQSPPENRDASGPEETVALIKPGTLTIPVVGVRPEQLRDTYSELRAEGRAHNALDIMAKCDTQVVAAHGCVVLTNPQVRDFVKHLARLGGTQISDEQIAEYEKNRTVTRPVKLSRAVQVDLRYETVTVEDGKLHIYRDVYDRGTNTEDNLRNVLQAYGAPVDQLSESQRSQVTNALSQMARGASGNPVIKSARADRSDSESGKVTRTIKGRKEVVIEIAALRGKGYPAPVDLDAGVTSEKAAPRSR